MDFSNEILRQIIVSHYSTPTYKKEVNDPAFKSIHLHSKNCIDDFILYLRIDNEVIKEGYFSGTGCAISTASIDIMCELLIDKSFDEANYLIQQFQMMMKEEPFDKEALGEAIAFINTSKQPSRIRCATIGYDGVKQIITDEENEKK